MTVPSNKLRVVIVLTKNVVKIISLARLVGCQVSRKLVALVGYCYPDSDETSATSLPHLTPG